MLATSPFNRIATFFPRCRVAHYFTYHISLDLLTGTQLAGVHWVPDTVMTQRSRRRSSKGQGVIDTAVVLTAGSALRRSSKLASGNASIDTVEKRVSFSSLEIYEFLIQIGDNPSCEGAPLCISNDCQQQRVLDLNEFEANRDRRRARKQLVLSPTKRSRL